LEATDRDLTAGNPERAATATGSAAPGVAVHGLGMRKRPSTWLRLLRNGKARLGAGLLIVIVLSALAAPVLAPYDPAEQNVRDKLAPPAWQAGGSWDHPLGTDQLGRDMLSRILYGGRVSLLVALFATIAASILGIVLGVLAGYFGRYVDAVIMRLVDVQMAFPSILLALAVMVMLGPSFRNLIIVLAVSSWVFFSRVIRADVLTIRHREFVTAGQAIGATNGRLITRYIFPNLIGVITVVATLTIARVVISEASLSFLGLGIQPPTSSWGLMLSEGRRYLSVAWWITTFPGIALMATVIGVNLLGDALRDILDPQLSHEG
jgi:peptide/nickel transport system permease protein